MTMPETNDGTLAQILVELGKVSTQVAVIGEQLKAIPDHEQRIRANEAKLSQLEATRQAGRDWWARVVAGVAVIAACAATAADFMHH